MKARTVADTFEDELDDTILMEESVEISRTRKGPIDKTKGINQLQKMQIDNSFDSTQQKQARPEIKTQYAVSQKEASSLAAKTEFQHQANHTKPRKQQNNFIISKISQVKQRNPVHKDTREETIDLAGLLPEHLRDLKPISAWQQALQHLNDFRLLNSDTEYRQLLKTGVKLDQSKNPLNLAYLELLEVKDDLYLLRLMLKTTAKQAYSNLQPETQDKLFKRVVKIAKGNFLDNLILDFFLESCESGLVEFLDRETLQGMVMVLEDLAKASDSQSSKGKVVNVLLSFLESKVKSQLSKYYKI